MTEADRVLVYFGAFLAAFLIAQTDQRRQRFAEGIAIALVFIAVIGLGSRLLPHVISVAQGLGSGARLRYPLGYWNANGVVFGIGVAMMLWMSRRSLTVALRWVAVGALPVLLLALYFTYSRGGLLALAVACTCLLVLSHDRLWLLATLGAGVLAALPAVLMVQARDSLAENLDNQAAVDQGVTVLLVLIAGIGVALLLFAGLRALERRGGQLTGRAVALSRNRRVLRGVALVGAVTAIGVAIAVGGRAWDQFTSSDLQFPDNPASHFSDLSGAGRHDFYRVAIDAGEEEPLLGHGAGTYQFSWVQLRSIQVSVHDAHSLYLEAFAELGLVGGLLVLGIVGAILWTGFSAWRHASGRQRELYAMLLAVVVTFAVSAAIDWFWEITVLGAVFFVAGAALVAGRCAQLQRQRRSANGRPGQRGFGLAIAGLAVAWIAAIALIGPLLVDHEIKASQAAAARNDFGSATEKAENARSIEPWAASPYVQLGLIAEHLGDYEAASQRLSQAIDREEDNWLLYYLRAQVERRVGDLPAARADLRQAQQLNPVEPCLRQGWGACG